MTCRKGEITRSDLQHDWPHRVALPAEKVSGLKNGQIVRDAAKALSGPPLTYSRRRDDLRLIVFCFAKAEHAEAFVKRFGGKRLHA